MSENDNDLFAIKINTEYAQEFEARKRREELSKLKEKYGSDYEEESSSTSEEEDENAELVTPHIDAQIMRTFAAIKTRDPEIYEKKDFFSPEELKTAEKQWKKKQKDAKKQKPVLLKDYHRQQLLEAAANNFEEPKEEFGYGEVEMQQRREDAKKSMDIEFSKLDIDDELFTVREKSEKEQENEELEYKEFLLKSMTSGKDLSIFTSDNAKDNLDENDRFLLDYMLNRGWMDKNMGRKPQDIAAEIKEVEEDDEELEAADEFEASYNFRYEGVVTYARDVPDSMRRPDDKRKRKRETKVQRKNEEKQRKEQELMRLKNLKKQEIKEKLEQIKAISGTEVDELDIEGDFDPEEHDRKMAEAFDDDFYDQEDEEIKREFSKKKSKEKSKKKADTQLEDGAVQDKLEELYQLDYEGLIGDLPTRFKYQKVEPDYYGLLPTEILAAKDKDLNEFIGIKKLAPYRPQSKLGKDKKLYNSKWRLKEFKKKLKKNS